MHQVSCNGQHRERRDVRRELCRESNTHTQKLCRRSFSMSLSLSLSLSPLCLYACVFFKFKVKILVVHKALGPRVRASWQYVAVIVLCCTQLHLCASVCVWQTSLVRKRRLHVRRQTKRKQKQHKKQKAEEPNTAKGEAKSTNHKNKKRRRQTSTGNRIKSEQTSGALFRTHSVVSSTQKKTVSHQ